MSHSAHTLLCFSPPLALKLLLYTLCRSYARKTTANSAVDYPLHTMLFTFRSLGCLWMKVFPIRFANESAAFRILIAARVIALGSGRKRLIVHIHVYVYKCEWASWVAMIENGVNGYLKWVRWLHRRLPNGVQSIEMTSKSLKLHKKVILSGLII